MESFTLAAPFRCDRVECLRREGSLSGQILVWSVSALPDFSGFTFNCGLLTRITVCSLPFMLIYQLGLALSLCYRLLLGFVVIFSECNLLCSFVFQFTHFISFCSFLFCLLY